MKKQLFLLKMEYKGLKLFFNTLKQIIPFAWMLRKSLFIHWHLAYGWEWKDYEVIWKELHKAHLIYARKLNKKYGRKLYNPGRKPTKRNAKGRFIK